ncbi:glycosyltransferase family 4 protein [Sanyastnella coralliicola]|uniref:glycosyltransferase family 4 protein n=1 Tax=Sanyastnella coralliicola TaxID=3069118 RepID=UPI0027BAC3B6|nr:glycosyltransferase family 4 protein [Longitalea sp. SCSIO 12813]
MKATKPVLGIISTWFERGATHVSLAYIAALQERFTIRVYARAGDEFPHNDPKWAQDFVHWGEFLPGALRTTIDWNDFSAWMKRENPAYLLFNEQHSWDVIHRLLGLKDRPLIGAYIDYYTDSTTPFFAHYDFLLCNTKRHYSVFEHLPGAMYVPWGVDLSLYSSPERAERGFRFFHSLGYNPDRKGTDLCVKAFKRLPNEDIQLILHAQRPLSDFPELQTAVESDQRIVWINKEVPPPGLYHEGDWYVYPSRLDGIGLSLPEALASGLPAIVPDEAPMNEFINEGENGFRVSVEKHWKREDQYYWPMNEVNVEALSNAMQRAVDDREQLESWQQRTLLHADEQLDWKKNAQHLGTALEKVEKRPIDKQLFQESLAFEHRQQPNLTFKHKMHRFLIKLGARQIKRAIFGRS